MVMGLNASDCSKFDLSDLEQMNKNNKLCYINQITSDIKKSLPIKVDKDTIWSDVKGDGKYLTFIYTLKVSENDEKLNNIKKEQQSINLKSLCNATGIPMLMKNDILLKQIYYSKNGKILFSLEQNKKLCIPYVKKYKEEMKKGKLSIISEKKCINILKSRKDINSSSSNYSKKCYRTSLLRSLYLKLPLKLSNDTTIEEVKEGNDFLSYMYYVDSKKDMNMRLLKLKKANCKSESINNKILSRGFEIRHIITNADNKVVMITITKNSCKKQR